MTPDERMELLAIAEELEDTAPDSAVPEALEDFARRLRALAGP